MANNNEYSFFLSDAKILWDNATNAYNQLSGVEIRTKSTIGEDLKIFVCNSGHSERYTDPNAYNNKKNEDYSIMIGTTIPITELDESKIQLSTYVTICSDLYRDLQNYISAFAGNTKQGYLRQDNIEVSLSQKKDFKIDQFSGTQIMTPELENILKDSTTKKMDVATFGTDYNMAAINCLHPQTGDGTPEHKGLPTFFSTDDKITFIMYRITYGIE